MSPEQPHTHKTMEQVFLALCFCFTLSLLRGETHVCMTDFEAACSRARRRSQSQPQALPRQDLNARKNKSPTYEKLSPRTQTYYTHTFTLIHTPTHTHIHTKFYVCSNKLAAQASPHAMALCDTQQLPTQPPPERKKPSGVTVPALTLSSSNQQRVSPSSSNSAGSNP